MNLRYYWIAAFSIFCVPAFALTSVTVNCNGGAADYPSISAAIAALKTLPVSGNAAIAVTGVCTENVVIDNFAELTLNGQPGAAIVSPNSSAAIRIDHSNKIVVHGFGIRGGNPAVVARRGAGIVIDSCNVGSPTAKGPGSGIRFEQQAMGFVVDTSVDNFTSTGIVVNDGSSLTVQANVPVAITNSVAGASAFNLSSLTLWGKITVQNNRDTGLSAFANSNLFVTGCNPGEMAIRGNGFGILSGNSNLLVNCPVVIEANSYYGIFHEFSGLATLLNAVIRNNGGAVAGADAPGAGVLVDGATFYFTAVQILNNIGPGVKVVRGSRGYLFDMTVQSNSTDGVQVSQGSVVEMSTFNTVTGHPGADLLCNTGTTVFGSKIGIGKITCPGFSSESGPKPFVPPIP